MKKKTFFSSIAILCATAVLTGCGHKAEQPKAPKSVNVAIARDASEMPPISFAGKTKAAEEVNVAFRVSGPLKKMLVKEGDYVTAGQVIAEMDDRDYKVQYTATQAEYNQIKADAERVMALYKEGNTTAQNYDKARYGLEQITQKLEHTRHQYEDTKLKAPISGYIKSKYHESGETVAAGMAIVNMTSADNVEVEINLPASEHAQMNKYKHYYCKFDVTGDQVYDLSVVRSSHEANVTQLYMVRLRIDGSYDRSKITPGMTTMVYAQQGDDESGLVVVPSTAVINLEGITQVYVYDEKTSKVKSVAVNMVNINSDGTTTIEGAGLHRGSKVVCTGANHIKDGQEVKVLTGTSKSNVGGLL